MRRLACFLVGALVVSVGCSYNRADLHALPDAHSEVGSARDTGGVDMRDGADGNRRFDAQFDVVDAPVDGAPDLGTDGLVPITSQDTASEVHSLDLGLDMSAPIPPPDTATASDANSDGHSNSPDTPVVFDAPYQAQTADATPGDTQTVSLLCIEGTKRCNDTALETCDVTGTWQRTSIEKGSCGAECTPVETPDGCNGKQILACGDNGRWQIKTLCEYPCKGGKCMACQPGSARCNGNIPQSCTTDGVWKNETACATLCVGAGKCTTCTPGAIGCMGTTPRTCSAAGEWVDEPMQINKCDVGCLPPGKIEKCNSGNCGLAEKTCTAQGKWGGCENTVGAEVTYYRDADGDLYGDPNISTISCTGAPAGYVTNNLDCCDNDGRANPAQTGYFADATGCGNWDYNCDNVQTKKTGQESCCSCQGVSSCPTTTCGDPIQVWKCSISYYCGGSTCSGVPVNGANQQCR